MPYKIRWIVDKRVVFSEFEGNVTADDVQEFIDELHTYIEEGIPLVHLISDGRGIDKIEMSLGTLSSVAKASKMTGQLGWQITINTNPLYKMFSGLGTQFAGVRSRLFPTIAEAIDFLKTNDPNLRDADWDIDLEHYPTENTSEA